MNDDIYLLLNSSEKIEQPNRFFDTLPHFGIVILFCRWDPVQRIEERAKVV